MAAELNTEPGPPPGSTPAPTPAPGALVRRHRLSTRLWHWVNVVADFVMLQSGLMIFNATGYSTFDRKRIPPKLMQILQTRYPQYLEPPPLGDPRANGTTWTVTKQWIDAQRAKAKEKK